VILSLSQKIFQLTDAVQIAELTGFFSPCAKFLIIRSQHFVVLLYLFPVYHNACNGGNAGFQELRDPVSVILYVLST